METAAEDEDVLFLILAPREAVLISLSLEFILPVPCVAWAFSDSFLVLAQCGMEEEAFQ